MERDDRVSFAQSWLLVFFLWKPGFYNLQQTWMAKTAYFILEHGACGTRQTVQWFSGIREKRNASEGIPFFRKMSSGTGRSIWFPTGITGLSEQMESALGHSRFRALEAGYL